LIREVVARVRAAIGGDMALLVKMNLRDAVKGGMEVQDAVALAQTLEAEGADAAVLSGGFVSRTPMYVMRGDVPLKELVTAEDRWLAKVGLTLFGRLVVKAYPFEEGYFLKDALTVRQKVSLPLVLVGGLNSLAKIDEALDKGFNFVAFARALLREPDFIAKLERGESKESKCQPCNKCMATMYHGESYCPEARG
jgi:2,4-dienoyl-CoA reductase-like NADH-dependent reductase (Old Yellow Enzyme family)